MISEEEPRPSCKTLFLCYEGNGLLPGALLVRTVSVCDLFSDNPESPPVMKTVLHYSSENICFNMGCGRLGSRIYILGGHKPDKENPELRKYSAFDLSSEVLLVFDMEHGVHILEPRIMPMKTQKADPLVVEVDKKLFVLPGSRLSNKGHSFESYDPDNNSWETIANPPFLDFHTKYFDNDSYRGFIVMGRKILVSSFRSSFAYDVDKKEWETCHLFDDLQVDYLNLHSPSEDEPLEGEPSIEKVPCGRPFGFEGQAFLHGDILICLALRRLVAYMLVDGKVVKMQYLEEFKLPPNTTFAKLVDLGSGFFCMGLTLNGDDARTVFNHLVSFKIWRTDGVEGDGRTFLKWAIINHFSYNDCIRDLKHEKILHLIGAFAM